MFGEQTNAIKFSQFIAAYHAMASLLANCTIPLLTHSQQLHPNEDEKTAHFVFVAFENLTSWIVHPVPAMFSQSNFEAGLHFLTKGVLELAKLSKI